MIESRTLITGATGFAGSHLIDRLAQRRGVIGWTRSGGHAHASPAIDWQPVDLLDGAVVDAALTQAKPLRVFHLAGAPQVDSSWASVVPHLQANVLGTHHLLDAIRRIGIRCRVLVVTSAQIYGTSNAAPISEATSRLPANPYGLSKLAQDDLAQRTHRDDGLDVVIARPFNHAGPRQRDAFVLSSFAKQIALAETGRAAPEIHVGNLDTARDITDVRDVVAAYERLMEAGVSGEAYNVASGVARRIGDLLDQLLSRSRVPIRIVSDPERMRPSDTPMLVGDATRLRHVTGWTPKIPIEQTLADTLDWWRERVA